MASLIGSVKINFRDSLYFWPNFAARCPHCTTLFPRPAVHHDRDGTIIQQFHLHHRPKPPGFRSFSRFPLQHIDELLVEWHRMLRSGGAGERRTVSFSCARIQRELTDDEKFAPDVDHGPIHQPLGISEDPLPDNLSRQPRDVFHGVRVFDPHQNQETDADLTDDLPFHSHPRVADPL
jgi:hypothetical protein